MGTQPTAKEFETDLAVNCNYKHGEPIRDVTMPTAVSAMVVDGRDLPGIGLQQNRRQAVCLP